MCCLVKHTYVPGWYLPGGGVDPGETADAAMRRELAEEANIRVDGALELVGLYQNRELSDRDHVALFTDQALRSDGASAARS